MRSRVLVVLCGMVALVACGSTPAQQDQAVLSPVISPEPERVDVPPTFIPEQARGYLPPSDVTRPVAVYPPPTPPEAYPAYATNPPVADTITLPPESTPLPFPSPDFGFILTYTPCLSERLDTFTQTYTKGITENTVATATITLSETDMSHIYAQMLASHYFEYPAHYETPVAPALQTTSSSAPPQYLFEVRNNGHWKRVEWVDYFNGSQTVEVEHLQSLVRLINTVFLSQPAIRALPQPQVGCL